MMMIRGDVDRFPGLAVYVRDGCLFAYRQPSYKCGLCEVIVASICSSSHNFYVFGVYLIPGVGWVFYAEFQR